MKKHCSFTCPRSSLRTSSNSRKRSCTKLNGNASQTVYELDCIRKDGSRITLEINSTVIYKDGQPVAVQGIARDITERRQSEEALRESEKRYRDLFENANDIIYTHDLRGNFTSLNQTGERITGYTRDEALKMNIVQVVAPESLASAREMTARKLAEDQSTTYEIDILAKDGRRVPLELSTRLILQRGMPIGVQGIGRDVTERRRAEEVLRTSEYKFRQLGEGIYHQVWTAEPDGRLDYVNQRTIEYFDRPAEEILGAGWQDLIHPDDLQTCLIEWSNSLATGKYYEVEFRLRRSDGVYRWHKARANAGRDSSGRITKWFGTNTDIDDQKQTEEKLNYLARHDALTGLPNRPEFMNHFAGRSRGLKDRSGPLCRALPRSRPLQGDQRQPRSYHGDKLLKSIADRLNALVRPGDVVARLGGDEFVILLNRTGSREEVVKVADRLQENLERPFEIDSYEVFTSASIGIIVSDDIMREPEDFLRDADSAMYRAKESGKARYEVFDKEMHTRNLNLLRVETVLRRAVERGDFEVLYQPIVDITDGTVCEFEALIRWRHPENGLIPPDEFISVAEETDS